MSANSKLAIPFGIIYFLFGLFGAVPAKGLAFAQVDGGNLFGLFGTNPFQNALEIIIGVGLIIAGASNAAKVVNRPVGVILLIIGVSGFFVMGTQYNPLAINLASAIFHTAVGAILLLTGIGADRARARALTA